MHKGTRKALARDCENPLNLCGTIRCLEGDVMEERAPRRKAKITATHTIPALALLQFVEKFNYQRSIDVLKVQL